MDKINQPTSSFRQTLRTTGEVAKLAAFVALESSEKLNKFTNFVTSGAVNRDTLAKGVLQFAVQAGVQFAVKDKLLGERSAELIPQIQKMLIDNNLAEMKVAVADLARTGLSSVISSNSGIAPIRSGKAAITELSSHAVSEIATHILGTNATEKLLHTVVKAHGWQPLDSYLQKSFSSIPAGNFIARKIHALLERSITQNSTFNTGEDATYKLMAGEVNEFLTGNKNYADPLLAYVGINKANLTPLADRASELLATGANIAAETSVQVAAVGGAVTAVGEALSDVGGVLQEAGEQYALAANTDVELATGKVLAKTGEVFVATGEVFKQTGYAVSASSHGVAAFGQALAATSAGLAVASARLSEAGNTEGITSALTEGFQAASSGLSQASEELKLAGSELRTAAGEGLSAANTALAAAAQGLVATGEGLSAVGVALASATGEKLTNASAILVIAGGNLLTAAKQSTAETKATLSNTVATQIDSLQANLIGESVSQDSRQAFGKDIQTASQSTNKSEPMQGLISKINASSREQDIAAELMKQAAVEDALGRPSTSSNSLAKSIKQAQIDGRIDKPKSEQLLEVVDTVSSQQLKPLSERGEIAVAHNWSGRLDRIEASNHAISPLEDTQRELAVSVLAAVATTTALVGNYKVASAYAQNIGELNLQLPENAYGAIDATSEAARTALNFGWGLTSWAMGYSGSDSGPTHAQSTELRQLYNTCASNEQALEICSRYLSPELAKATLVPSILKKIQLHENGSKLFDTGSVKLELQNIENPEYRFQVQRTDNLITIGMDAVWKIMHFGNDANSMRSPVGNDSSQLSAGAIITIEIDSAGGPPTINHTILDVVATVNNVISFDQETGAQLG